MAVPYKFHPLEFFSYLEFTGNWQFAEEFFES